MKTAAVLRVLIIFFIITTPCRVSHAKPPAYTTEFFDQLKSERSGRIAEMRKNINLDEIPKWRTDATANA